MIARASFLHDAGYSVLLIDLPAHGESDGARITFGYREARGVEAAVAYLRKHFPAEPTAVVGASLGAAAFVLASISPPLDAAVLESLYPTLEQAVAHRLQIHLGAPGGYLTPLLLWQLPLRLGVTADELRPIAHLPSLRTPAMIIGGTEDRHTTAAETRALYAKAAAPKVLWLVEGAAHVDLHAHDPVGYEARVSSFLRAHLGNSGKPAR